MHRSLVAATALVLSACARAPGGPAPAPAQEQEEVPLGPSPAERACLDSIPDSLMTRDTIYLRPYVLDSTARELVPLANDVARRVAERTRRLLHSGGDTIPAGERTVDWRSTFAGGTLEAVLHRDGRVEWHVVGGDSLRDTTATTLLSRAVATIPRPTQVVPWPPGSAHERISVRLVLAPGAPRTRGRNVRPEFPVFSLREPRMERPEMVYHPDLHYPDAYRRAGKEARILMEYVVAMDGTVEASSIRLLSPQDTGDAFSFYHVFAQAAATMLMGSEFRPGRIGGCAARVRIRQPIYFLIARRPDPYLSRP